jgi:hypothetical protein
MAPAVIMAIASAVQAVAPLIKSGVQKHRLKKLGDVERPDFQIPEAADEQLGLARSIASNRNMPGYNEALDKIENQTNRAIGDVKAAGGNMQDVMAAMAAANVGAGMQKRDLSIANDRSYLGTLQNLQGQLGQYANWQNAQQQDEMKKYTDEMARRAALETAGQQNKQAGIGAISQGIAQYGGYQMNMDMMDKQYQNNLALQNAGFDLGMNKTVNNPVPNSTSPTVPSSISPSSPVSTSATAPLPAVIPNAAMPAAVTAQTSGQMPFPDFSQVVTRDQFINSDLSNNTDLNDKLINSIVKNDERLGINYVNDSREISRGKYYDWLIANQGAITPQMSAYPIMEGIYNMYKK